MNSQTDSGLVLAGSMAYITGSPTVMIDRNKVSFRILKIPGSTA